MSNNLVLHALSLLESGDYKQLEYLLSNVQNIRKLWRRALRLGVWRKISQLKWSLITLVANTLERIRSKILLKSILEAIVNLLPNLLTKSEKRIIETSREILNLVRMLKIDIAIPLEEYVFIHTIKQVTIEHIGFTVG